jgi:hypothetical protein
MRTTPRSFGRERDENAASRAVRPSARTAAMSLVRRKRAAFNIFPDSGDGQALASTCATRRKNFAATCRPHSRAKTVHSRAATRLWLIRALHDRPLLPVKETDV